MDTITLYQNNLFVKEIGPPYRKTFSLARWINHSEGKLRHQCELEKLLPRKKNVSIEEKGLAVSPNVFLLDVYSDNTIHYLKEDLIRR